MGSVRMRPNGSEVPITSCFVCPVGKASGVGQGGRCPFVDRFRQPGEFVYLQGEPANFVWFIKTGTVVLARAMGDSSGEESARAVRHAGSFLGLEALVQPTYLDSARAATRTTLCGAPREAVDGWLGAPGTPARTALEQVLRTQAEEVPRGASPDGNAVRRVARWLVEEAREDLAPGIPRRFVANLLGMVPETFSRALARLAEAGAIEVTRRTLRIRDRQALITAAGAQLPST